jgi:hypothetical protein
MTKELIDGAELRKMVRAEAKKFKTNAEFARSIEIYPSFLGNFLSGEKGPGFKILAHMGYREVTLYEKINGDE